MNTTTTTNIPFVMASAFRISKIASVIYDQDAVLYVNSHNEAHMMAYDPIINGNCVDTMGVWVNTIGNWVKVQSIDGLQGVHGD